MSKRLIGMLIAILSISFAAQAQVTTSGIIGTITDGEETLIGALVTATHQPSGTVYRAVTNSAGQYTITSMRSGGPYEVVVSYIGFKKTTLSDIMLELGQNFVLNAALEENTEKLQEVHVVASSAMRSDRAGAVTTLKAEQMRAVPMVDRNIASLMKMTPQAVTATAVAIGGGNYRQSNVTIDGASYNNAFGMGFSPLPGGGTPIPLDALEQISVFITPFDVRQSGFTGGAINAVTKSGTNEFSGSAYTYLTSTSMKGNRINKFTLPVNDGHSNTYGLSLGGPIVRDRLFFFVNGEFDDNRTNGPSALAGDGTAPYTTINRRPQLSELESLSDYMQTQYGIHTGPWQSFNIKTPAYRVLARLDWNINDNHQFWVRFSKSNSKESHPASSSRSIGSNRANIIYGGNKDIYGSDTNYGMSSLSSRYYIENRFTSLAAELNSKLGILHNTLRATYSFQDQPRSNEYGESTPVVEVVMDDGQGHYPTWAMLGDPFTYGNLAQTKNIVITDELNAQLGKHSIFGGLQFERTHAANGYAQAAAGYYAFAATPDQVAASDWASVFTPANTRLFGITFGNNDAHSMFTARMSLNQWSLYVQDNISLSNRLRLSAGLRFELPSYPALKDNFNEDYYNIVFGNEQFRTDNVPDAAISISPRVGFNWDVTGRGNIIVRGGTGIFVGRLPFMWLVSSVLNSGMGQTTYIASQSRGTIPTFTTSQQDMLQQIGATSSTTIPSSPTILSDDLRMPRTWKSSLALDAHLPGEIDLTVEGIYNRDINPVVVSNRDIYWDGTSTIDLGHGDVRHSMSYYNANYSAYILENAGSKAYYMSLTAQLRKSFDFGLDLRASYTWSKAKSYTEGIGDQVSSAYNLYRNSVNAVNDNETGYSTYVTPHRLLASATYNLRESKNTTSTFSLIYDGYVMGYMGEYPYSRFSYIFSTNVNNDALAPGNLIYIPSSREELNTWNFADNGTVDGSTYTADMQRDDFWSYICQDSYLSNHKGQYAERGGAQMPWHHQLDFKYVRSMKLNVGATKHTLQLGLDILNLPNLLCKDWGLYKQVNNPSLLTYRNGQYTYNLVDGHRNLKTSSNYLNAVSAYQMMFTIRYLFN